MDAEIPKEKRRNKEKTLANRTWRHSPSGLQGRWWAAKFAPSAPFWPWRWCSRTGEGGAPPVAGRRPTVGTPAAAAVTRPPNAATACRPPTGHWTRPDPSGPARPRRADRSSHLHRVRNETKQQQQHGNRETRRRQMRTTTWWWLVRAATDRWRVGPFWPKPSVAFVPTDADGSAAQRPSACLTRHLRNTNERRLGRRAAETGAHIKSMTNERSTHVRPTADQALEVERKRNDR